MPKNDMIITKCGTHWILKREQWQGSEAIISDHPGLIDEVVKYTWTYTAGKHPYLRCSKLNISLHEFVLSFLYGKGILLEMLSKDNIIEHLDNNGLNCTYENLHILSSDYNKAKAFTIDKDQKTEEYIQAFAIDVYYSHNRQEFQMQIFLNNDIYFHAESGVPIEMFLCKYKAFRDLYIDWIYILDCRQTKFFDIGKFHANMVFAQKRPLIELKPGEEDAVIIERNGKYYLRLNTEEGGALAFVNKTAMRDIE